MQSLRGRNIRPQAGRNEMLSQVIPGATSQHLWGPRRHSLSVVVRSVRIMPAGFGQN